MLFLYYSEKDDKAWFVFYLLVIAVIPAALTYEDSPNISRSIAMIVPFVILGAFGVYAFFTKTKLGKFKKPLLVFFCLFLLLEFIYFWHEYSIHAKTFEPVYRNEGNKALISYVLKNKGKYEHIYMPSVDDLLIYYLFYSNDFEKLKPATIRNIESGGKLHGINFVNNLCIDHLIKTKELNVPKNSLVIIGGDCENVDFPTKVIVARSDGTNAYKVLEIH